MKVLQKLLTAALIAALFVYALPGPGARASIEVFSAYQEVDTYSQIGVSSANITWSSLSVASGRVYTDKGANYITGDFALNFTYRQTAHGNTGGNPMMMMGYLSTDNNSTWNSGSNPYMGAVVVGNGSTLLYMKLRHGGLTYDTGASGYSVALNTTYYLTISRTGSTESLKVYTDSARTVLVSNQSLSYAADTYRYFSALIDQSGGGEANARSGWLANAEFTSIGSSAPVVDTISAVLESSGNLTFTGNLIAVGSANVTTAGFQVAEYSASYSANYTDTVNYGAAPQTFTKNISPADLGLVAGTIYKYRAKAVNSAGTSYGPDQAFTFYGDAPTVTTDSAAFLGNSGGNTQMWALSGTLTDKGSIYPVTLGFNIGRTSGAWESNAGLIPQTTNATINVPYVEVATALLPDTTYYYQAVGHYFVDLYTSFYGYGDILSFNTGNETATTEILPDVVTVSAILNEAATLYTLKGRVEFSTLPIVQRGFNLGTLTEGMTANISESGNYGAGGTWELTALPSQFGTDTSVYSYLTYQAWATDSAGNTGYGAIKNVQVLPSAGGAAVSMVSATASGSNVALIGQIDSVGLAPLTLHGFAWNTTNNLTTSTQWWETDPDGYQVGQFNHTVTGLEANTQYYFWAGVGTELGSWVWSDAITETTGAASGGLHLYAPAITTGAANSITANSFNATMTITENWDTPITSWGFDVGTESGHYVDMPRQNGSFGEGAYWWVFASADWIAGQTIFYRAVATSQYGTSYGAEYYVVLTTSGAGVGGAPTTGRVSSVGDWSARLRAWMASLGMDNPTGHWGFMFLLIGLVTLILGIPIVYLVAKKERMIAKILAFILLILIVAIAGAFLFSLLLGWWPIIILIMAVVGIWLMIGGRAASEGRV